MEIPIDCWVEIFRFCDPISLANMRRTCNFFWALIEKYCYKWEEGKFKVNGIPWGLQKFWTYYHWITDTYKIEFYPGKTVYSEGKLKITYEIEGVGEDEGLSITSFFNGNSIYKENQHMGVTTRTYFIDRSYKTDQYYYINRKLAVFSLEKDGIKIYSARQGLIFSIDPINETVTFKEEIERKLSKQSKTRENLQTEILSRIHKEFGRTSLGKMEFVLRKKQFLSYL